MSGVIITHESTTGIVTDPKEHDTYGIHLNGETIGWGVYLTERWHAVPRSTTGYSSDEDGVLDADAAHDSCKTFSDAAPTDTFNDVVSGLLTHWDHLDMEGEDVLEEWTTSNLRYFAAQVVTAYGVGHADSATNDNLRSIASDNYWGTHAVLTDAELTTVRAAMRRAVIVIDGTPYGEEI